MVEIIRLGHSFDIPYLVCHLTGTERIFFPFFSLAKKGKMSKQQKLLTNRVSQHDHMTNLMEDCLL